MKQLKVSLTSFQFNVVERMIGAYGSSMSEVGRFIIQSYLMEHGDAIAKRLARYEEWRKKTHATS